MATRTAAQSLRNLLIALVVVGSFTTACKKSGGSDPDIDPRDQYVGAYEGGEGGYQGTIMYGTLPVSTEKGTAVITVAKSANTKEIYIDINSRLKLTAELNGTNFSVIDKNSDQIVVVINGQRNVYESNYSATGVLGKDQATGKETIVINTTAEALQQGTTIKRTELIVGLRK